MSFNFLILLWRDWDPDWSQRSVGLELYHFRIDSFFFFLPFFSNLNDENCEAKASFWNFLQSLKKKTRNNTPI